MTKENVKKIMASGNGPAIAVALKEYWAENTRKRMIEPSDESYKKALKIFGVEPTKQMTL